MEKKCLNALEDKILGRVDKKILLGHAETPYNNRN